MILQVLLLILVIGSLPQSRGVPFENSEAHKLLTTGEAMASLTLLKREISSEKAAGRGLVYSGPVRVMINPKDRTKYYVDQGSAFDSTAQEPPHVHRSKSARQ